MKKMIAIALAVLMLAGLATVAFADDSPVAQVVHKVSYIVDGSLEKTIEVKDGDSITITAPEKAGYTFVKMTIDGDFEEAARLTKEYTTPTVTITPKGDIRVTFEYKKADSSTGMQTSGSAATGTLGGTASAPAGPVDNSATSPDTGVNYAAIVLAMVLGVCGVVVASKKLFN